MKNVKKLKKGRVIASTLILVLVALIVGIVKIASIDKYAGLVKVQNATLASMSTKLSANISDLSEDNNIEVKGYDEIDYNISYKLSEVVGDRDVIINAKIDDSDIYSSFKEVTGENISSVLSSNRKEITITISNLPSGQTINSKITMIIEGAPTGYSVSPTVRIKESTGDDYTNVTVKPVTVNTSSLIGSVIDEDGNIVPNILISLKKNNDIIKETYTSSEGKYTFSDITPDTYSVVVNEENYENLELNNIYIENGNMLNLIVKKVYPYKIETNKYITKVELSNLGSSKDYLYNDTTLAQIPVKKVDNLHGKIYYKITVQNTGEKAGIIAAVKDELPEGLSFDESLNSGYELKNGIIYNRNLEGVELSAGEMISDTLVLTIENTDVAKTYINKVNAKGEIYEHVVYLLDGRVYKTLDVLEGETIDEPTVSIANFNGWYTDEKLTNKYKFTLPVNKDLILYGVTKAKHTVTFNDKHPETLVVEEYRNVTVDNGELVQKPTPDPQKTGYDFCGWVNDNNVEWDFNTPITSDLTLTSKYCIKSYDVEFYDKSASNGAEYAKVLTISKEYKSIVSNSEAPDLSNVWAGHTFLRWTTDQDGQNEYDFTSLIKGPVKLYAQYSLQDRSFIFNDENRITEKRVDYGATVQPIADQGKNGHTFKHWSLEVDGATPYDFSTPIYVSTTVYAVYQINTYNVVFNDTDPWTNVTEEYDNQTVDHGDKAVEPVEPSKEGHTFCGWKLNGNDYDFDTPVTGNITLESCYTKNKVNVYFMNGTDIWETKQVEYADTVSAPATNPVEEHKIFNFWSEDGTTSFDYSTQIKEDKYLYATFDDITAPTITHTPLYWTNDKVLVTITHTSPVLTFKYKVDDGTYQDYTEPFELSTNSTITAKSIYEDSESEIATHEVTNIDKLNPIIGDITPTSTQTTILLSGIVSDNESGVMQIKVYNGNVLVGTVNGTANNIDLRDYQKSRDMNIVISDLTLDTEYTFRIEVMDGAGNVTEDTMTARTSPEEPICQIISIDGVDLNSDDYLPFTKLEYAIKDTNCISKCTIQMLKSTNESVEILDTQDITLDLNGKSVAGVLPGYTINNQGEFTLIDHGTSKGGIINGNGIGIFNNTGAKLTLGEGSSEAPVGTDTREVYQYPYVFGETYGIYSERNSEFSFFDGKIRSNNAVQGEVTETEYAYNATSNMVTGYEEVTLAIQAEPEARINKSKYYANFTHAVPDTNGGTVELQSSNNSFLEGFTHVDEETSVYQYYDRPTGFPFIYDPNANTLTSYNPYYGSIAFTETIVDLTDYDVDPVLELRYHVEPNSDGSYGTATVQVIPLDDNYVIKDYPSSYNNSKSYETLYTLYNFGDIYGYRLTKGMKYKIKMSFMQPISVEQVDQEQNPEAPTGIYLHPNIDTSPKSKLVVTGATLQTESLKEELPQMNVLQGNTKVAGFYYDAATDTIRSNTQYSNNPQSFAYGYVEIDLTDYVGTYELTTSMSVETAGSSDSMLNLTEDAPSPMYSTGSANMLNYYTYVSSYDHYEEFTGFQHPFVKVGPLTATKQIQGGKKYYLNFGFYRYMTTNYPTQEEFERNNISDQLIINSIKVYRVSSNPEDLDIVNNFVGNGLDFGKTYTSGGEEYYSLDGYSKSDYRDSYIKIDLTDSEVDKVISLTGAFGYYNYASLYITKNNRGLTPNELMNNREKLLMCKDDFNSTGNIYFIYSSGSKKDQNFILEKGNVYYVHFNLRTGIALNSARRDSDYYCESSYGDCGTLIQGMSIRDVAEVVYSMGKTPINVGTIDNDSLEEDTENDIVLNHVNDIPNVRNTYETGYIWDEELQMYTLERELNSFEAAAWVGLIDMTNETEEKQYKFVYQNATNYDISYYDWYTEDELYPVYYYKSGNSPSRDYTYYSYYGNAYLTFKPGHKYYLYHFVYRYTTGLSHKDAFRFEELVDTKTTEYNKGEKVVLFNEKVDEVQLLKNVTLTSTVTVDFNKEMILDLNGHKLTGTIKNNGKLTIMDSDYEGQTSENKTHNGEINTNTAAAIINSHEAELIIKNLQINVKGQGGLGISNYGNVNFVPNYDSKIYVNSVKGTGIKNQDTGIINDTSNSVEIVLNYNNQANYNYGNGSVYKYLYNLSGRPITLNDATISQGIINYGFYSAYGMKITGKHGTGFRNTPTGVAVIKNSTINVDINYYDKITKHDKYSDYNYIFQYGSSASNTAVIRDYSVRNEGIMTIMNSSTIGTRTYNSNQLFLTNGALLDYLDNESKLVVNNGSGANTILNNGPASMLSSATVKLLVDNYNEMQFQYIYESNNAVVNNHDTGIIRIDSSTLGQINNYDKGQVYMMYASAKHLYNESYARMSQSNISGDAEAFDEAILNKSLLDLEYGNNIGSNTSPAKYGILLEPKGAGTSSNPYKQLKVNIGTKDDVGQTNNIYGYENAVAGACYKTPVNPTLYYTGSGSNRKASSKAGEYIEYLDGTKEVIDQSNYDQDLCVVNLYTGYLASKEYPGRYNRSISVPINETLDNSFSYWKYDNNGFGGLSVVPRSEAPSNVTAQARIGSTEYATIQDAIDSVSDSTPTTIDVIKWAVNADSIIIPEGKNITLNLDSTDGWNSAYFNKYGYINNGNLTLTGDAIACNLGKYLFVNNGTLTINNGKYYNEWSYSNIERSLVKNNGTATINDGYLNKLDVNNFGNLTINDGTYNGSMVYGTGENSLTTVKGGYFPTDSGEVNTYFAFKTAVNQFYESSWRYMFEVNDGAKVLVDGLNTSTDTRYTYVRPIGHVDNATLEFKDTVISQLSDVSNPFRYVSAENGGNVIFDSGTYDNIYIDVNGGKVTVNGGNFTAYENGSTTYNLIYLHGIYPQAEIYSGVLNSKQRAIGLSDFTNGYNIVIGTKGDKDENDDLIVSQTIPMLTGETWSIAKYGSGSGVGFTGFYDGILRGKSGASDISFDEIEDDYEIIDDSDNPYSIKYLDQKDLVKNMTTGEVYKSFQKAFNEATNGDVLETLRSYTNTKYTSTIVIPETSNFTLNIKHPITVNNEEFIINNGTATFNTRGDASGHIAVNVASNVFINNGTLTLLVDLDDLKSDGVKREIILNNATGTLNINNSVMTTVQRVFVNNLGTLNMNVEGTNDSHTSNSFDVVYVPGDGGVDDAFINSGTANIKYMTLSSDYLDTLIENSGNITIDNSVLDQSGISITTSDNQYAFAYKVGGQVINTGNMTIKNSDITYALSSVERTSSDYDFDTFNYYVSHNGKNSGSYFVNQYSYNSTNSPSLILDNNTIETSVLGLIYQNGSSNAYDEIGSYPYTYVFRREGPNHVTVKNCDVHNMSYGIRKTGYTDIDFKDNTFNIRDSIIMSFDRYNGGGPYTQTDQITIGSPKHYDAHGHTTDSTIDIDGGTYNTNAASYLDSTYTTNKGETMTLKGKSEYYKVSAIENSGILNIKNASINIIPLPNPLTNLSDRYTYSEIFSEYIRNDIGENYQYRNYGTPSDWFGAITTFEPVTIINSTINGPIRSYSEYGVVTLGEKDGVYDDQKPYINSPYNDPIKIYKGYSKIKFYDGLISTSSSGGISISNTEVDIDKNFGDIEDGYIISGTSSTRYLTKESVIKNITQDVGYTSVQEAISDANNNDELIFLKPTVRVSVNDDAIITGKTLTIDTNCKSIANHLTVGSGANVSFVSSACGDSGRTESNLDLVSTIDDGIITLSEGKGIVNASDNSVVNLTSASTYTVSSYDNAVINVSNNTAKLNKINAYNDSIVNVNDGQLKTTVMNDDTTLNVTCSGDNTSSIQGLNYSSSNTLEFACGSLSSLSNNETIHVTGGRVIGTNNGTMVFDDNNETAQGIIYNYGTMTINDGKFHNILNFSNLVINGGTFNGVQPNKGTVTVNDGTIESTSHDNQSNTGKIIINDGLVKYLSVNSYNADILGGKIGYINANSGRVNIGSKDGNINTSSPEINPKFYSSTLDYPGVILTKASIYFYDGTITGSSSKGVIKGSIAGTEDNYKIGIVNNGDGTETAYLTPITVDDSLVAVVNGINYNSLQQAVNKSILNCEKGADCPSITVYHNLELDADITVPDGYTRINIISNGYTLSTNGYHMSSIILWDGKPVVYPEDLGGNILNGLRGVLGSSNTADVLVYEMSDGSALSTENHYRLYKYDGNDYDLVTMEKGDEVARYNPGRGIENMKPIKGRLYLTDLEPGNYKVVDDNNSELVFTINDDLTLSGHVKEYIPSSNKIEANGEAKLLISIQTGIRRVNYMLIAISIIAVLSVMFVLQRRKQNKKNLV